MTCVNFVHKSFWKEHLYALQVFLCVLVSRHVCARTRSQLTGNIDSDHFLASAYEGEWPCLFLAVSSSHRQRTVSLLITSELVRRHRWNRNLGPLEYRFIVIATCMACNTIFLQRKYCIGQVAVKSLFRHMQL